MTTKVTVFFELDMAYSLEPDEIKALIDQLDHGVEMTCRGYSAVKKSGAITVEEVGSGEAS